MYDPGISLIKNLYGKLNIRILIFKQLNKKRDANLRLYNTLSCNLKDYNIIYSYSSILDYSKLKNKGYEKYIPLSAVYFSIFTIFPIISFNLTQVYWIAVQELKTVRCLFLNIKNHSIQFYQV